MSINELPGKAPTTGGILEKMVMHGVDQSQPKKVAENITPEWMNNRLQYLNDQIDAATASGDVGMMQKANKQYVLHIKKMRMMRLPYPSGD